jgi:hypothetical protein
MSVIEQFDSRREAILRATVKNYVPAIACALTPLLCYFVVRPFAEIGILDDWSYIKTTQVLAQTGHIVYNGWATAMLGWQLYFGALFVKILGFSFTTVRFATVVESMATAFLLQRTFVRAGLNSWNATLATMTFILSPVCFPLEFTFLTDISGVLSIVVCFYMCLRALEAESELAAIVWISLAALLNAVGGTARQIAWLGVLVMVPSTLWLLRRNRRVLIVGCLACIAGACVVAASMAWYARQPYTILESLDPGKIDLISVRRVLSFGVRNTGQLTLLALPVLLMFAGTLRSWNRRKAVVFLTGLCCFVIPGIAVVLAGRMYVSYPLFVNDNLIFHSFENLKSFAALGNHLAITTNGLRLLLAAAMVLGILSLVSCSFAGTQHPSRSQQAAAAISWQKLAIMFGPFTMAYIALLMPRAMRGPSFDPRYLLPLLAILLFVLARYYQERVNATLPSMSILLIAIFGGFSLAATHDMFAMYRGYVSAISQLLSTGASVTSIAGPVEFDGWTEIEKVGHMNESRIQLPKGAWVPPPVRSFPADCDVTSFLEKTPAINPAYVIVLNPTDCGGQQALPPVTYTTWIAPHVNWVYSVRLPPPFSSVMKPVEP